MRYARLKPNPLTKSHSRHSQSDEHVWIAQSLAGKCAQPLADFAPSQFMSSWLRAKTRTAARAHWRGRAAWSGGFRRLTRGRSASVARDKRAFLTKHRL